MGHLINFLIGWIIALLVLELLFLKNVLLWDFDFEFQTESLFGKRVVNDMLLKWK